SFELQEEASPGLVRESIEFTENAMDLSVHQLVSREWSFGAHYRLAHAELESRYPEYAPALFLGGLAGRSRAQGWLQTLELSALYRHASGLFGRVEGNWFSQEWREDNASREGDEFWQLNLVAGYRFPRHRGEVALGVLNALGGDYRLHPINQHPDLPRSRTFYARILLNF